MKTSNWVATTFGLGNILPAPGTFAGSLPAAVLWYCLARFLGASPWLTIWTTVAVTVATVAGLWATEIEIRARRDPDPGPVVIDEVAGQLLTYLCALPLWTIEDPTEAAVFAVVGFLLFRIFDILKPWPICRLEKLGGSIGVMVDDLAAGLAAGLLLGLGRPVILDLFARAGEFS